MGPGDNGVYFRGLARNKIECKLLSMTHVYLQWCESESRLAVSDYLRPHGLYSPWNSPGQNTGVGSLSLLQGIFPTQGSNLGLLHRRRIRYQLRHKVSYNGKHLLKYSEFFFSFLNQRRHQSTRRSGEIGTTTFTETYGSAKWGEMLTPIFPV